MFNGHFAHFDATWLSRRRDLFPEPCMNESLMEHPNVKASSTGNWKFHFDEVSLEKASHNINQPFIQTRHPKMETYLWREGAKTTLQGCSF